MYLYDSICFDLWIGVFVLMYMHWHSEVFKENHNSNLEYRPHGAQSQSLQNKLHVDEFILCLVCRNLLLLHSSFPKEREKFIACFACKCFQKILLSYKDEMLVIPGPTKTTGSRAPTKSPPPTPKMAEMDYEQPPKVMDCFGCTL